MTCEACDGDGRVHYTEEVVDERAHDGKRLTHWVAACLCSAGLKRVGIKRIDKVFPLDVVAHEYFPTTGIPRDVIIEISDREFDRIGITKKMRAWTLDSYPDREAPQLATAREWLRGSTHRDLMLMGPPGTGKTGLAVGMLRALFVANRTVKFVQANEWLLQLQATFNARTEGESELDLLAPAFAPYLLVLDDLNARRADKQTGRMSEYFADVLQLILDKRQGQEKPTILTTNLDQEELDEYLTPAIVDRLREGEFWPFTGESNRMPKPVLPFTPRGGRKTARKKR